MDSTKNDSLEVKRMYEIAYELREKYHIGAYPTFLFFSPKGLAVHKEIGYRDREGFWAIARAAMDSRQQYFTLLTQYEANRLSYDDFPLLAKYAKELLDTSLLASVSLRYIHYLQSLPTIALWTKSHIEFISNHKSFLSAKDSIFMHLFEDRNKINEVMADSVYANRIINYVVYNEYVKPSVLLGSKNNYEPKWKYMERIIRKKYGREYAEGNIIAGRVSYYQSLKMWKLYSKYYILNLKLDNVDNLPSSPWSSFRLNNYAFEVFKYSNNKSELETALVWVNKAISMANGPDANEMDTKANILYKLGRREEGLVIEAQSANLAPADKEIQSTFGKMKNGLPTWE